LQAAQRGELVAHGVAGVVDVRVRGAAARQGLDEGLFESLAAVAAAAGIAHGVEAMPGGGSTHTDVDNALDAVRHLRAALIGLPLRHMHSPAEVCDLADVEGAARLLGAWCLQATPETLA
ncbi:MAG: hypothetical protein ACKOSO_02685, partial [Actinomycetota bacterium]